MQKKQFTFLIFFITGTLFLFPGFHGDQWNRVTLNDYQGWQTTSERVVVARLAKSQQDGPFSAGGLLGLLDSDTGWIFGKEIADHQYEVYETGQEIKSYLVYKSHPGFQGIVFSLFDRVTSFTPTLNLQIFRASVALGSSAILALLASAIAIEFGWLAGIFFLFFPVLSEWMILPAGSLYWNLWAFYLPFTSGIFFLANGAKKNSYPAIGIYSVIFLTTLIKILFTGFELITTALVMATVPFIYFAVRDRWNWNIFITRMLKLGLVLTLATITGLGILAIQIAANDGNFYSSYEYISDTLNRRATGNPEDYRGVYAESLEASAVDVVAKYLSIQAFEIPLGSRTLQVVYAQLILMFALLTGIYSFRRRFDMLSPSTRQGVALAGATWYSLAAPLSWYIIFKPTSYIHTFLFPMAWQMPFVLLGFALCGFVIQEVVKTKTVT
ncbi:MAG TPA: hypothetical protein VJ022_05920 [Anaerolineales bacterium]|nr:hypothetical protein [Anaerolineales bacterium]